MSADNNVIPAQKILIATAMDVTSDLRLFEKGPE